MKILILFLCLISLNSYAVDVTTLTMNKNSTSEMILVSTDDTLTSSMEKHFMARACKLRIGMNSVVPVKEIAFPSICRAEVIQFLLNKGLKPDPYFQTFIL